MAWNKPGSNGNDKEQDPWTGKNPQSPSSPDFEAVIRKLYQKLNGGFSKPKSPEVPPNPPQKKPQSALVAVFVIFALWLLSGIYVVGPAETAIVLHWGRYVKTVSSGVHWLPTFIDKKFILNDKKIFTYSYEGEALTKDAQNVVLVKLALQYRIADIQAYLFSADDALGSMHQATAGAVQQVMGQFAFNDVFTSGRDAVRQQLQDVLSKSLQTYKTGLVVTDLTLEKIDAPDKVKTVFAEAIKAAQEAQEMQDQARAYDQQIMPVAEGEVKRLLTEAQAYKQQTVLNAQGEVARFLALLPAYQQSPELLRQRLYISTMEAIFAKAPKVLVDSNIQNVVHLPLNKWFTLPLQKPVENNVAANETTATPPTAETPVSEKKSDDSYGSGGYL